MLKKACMGNIQKVQPMRAPQSVYLLYPKSFAHILGRCWSAQLDAISLSMPDLDK